MRKPLILVTAGLVLAGVSTTAMAQTRRTVPAYCANYEGSSSNKLVAGWADMRLHVLYEGGQIATGKGIIVGMAFRRDCQATTTFKAQTYHRKITLDHTKKLPTAISSTFANNLGPTATVVFDSKTVNFPAMPPMPLEPAPFTLLFSFPKPFMYDRTQGNLIMEMIGVGPGSLYNEWVVDSHSETYGIAGKVAPLGKYCAGSGGVNFQGTPATTSLTVGGSFSLSYQTNISKPTAMLQFIGVRGDKLGPLTLPLDLGFIGATGCMLYTSMEIVVASAAVGGQFPPLALPLPNVNELAMAELFTQGVAQAFGANPAGILFTGGYRCLIWPSTRPATTINSIGAADSSATMSFASRTPYGPVTQFHGSLP